MKKMLLALMLLVSGCGTVPYSAVDPWNLDGDKVIFFEQTDRVPKDVLIEAIKSQMVPTNSLFATNSLPTTVGALPPEIIAEIIAEVLKIIPPVTSNYCAERMNEALVGRRILIKGNWSTNELVEVDKIIKTMGGCIEYWTQPNK